MLPIRRDLKFNLPADRVTDWHPWGKHLSHFWNSLSIFFPVGERFFIQSVRYYRDKGIVTDDKLKEAITAFIGQEAMHGREHEEYNETYAQAGFEVKEMEGLVKRLLDFLQKTLPPDYQLSATIALEHFTAILAHMLLDHPEFLEGADEEFRDVWYWHSLEETEHKAVAYDVYRAAMQDRKVYGYAIRMLGIVIATGIFWGLVYPFYLRNLQKDGQLFNIKGWASLIKFHLWKPGMAVRMLPLYLDYYRPGFHPWDHDNRHFLEMVEDLANSYDRRTGKHASVA